MTFPMLPNQFTGTVHAKPQPQMKTPPIWKRECNVGNSERFFVKIKIYAQQATLQYPNTCIKFSAYDARGGCYTRIAQPSDLRSLAEFLLASALELDGLMPALRETETKVKQALLVANSLMPSADNESGLVYQDGEAMQGE